MNLRILLFCLAKIEKREKSADAECSVKLNFSIMPLAIIKGD